MAATAGSFWIGKGNAWIAEDSFLYVQRGRNKVLKLQLCAGSRKVGVGRPKLVAEIILQRKFKRVGATLAFQTSPESILWGLGRMVFIILYTGPKHRNRSWQGRSCGVVQSVVVYESTDDVCGYLYEEDVDIFGTYHDKDATATGYDDFGDKGLKKAFHPIQAIPGVVTVPITRIFKGDIVRYSCGKHGTACRSVYKVAIKTSDTFEYST